MFKIEKLPYFLVALFAILSWDIVHIVDRIGARPTIKWSVEAKAKDSTTQFTYHIENITDDKIFTEIDFLLDVEGPDSILSAKQYVYPPIKMNSTEDIFNWGKRSVSFHLGQFQPNCSFDIVLLKRTEKALPIRLSSKSIIYLSEPTYETYILENESCLLNIVFFVCLGLIVVYVIFIDWKKLSK
jgi:hypothetical protein